jgi:uncharacterized protein GlcG (DUF336 family)
MLAPTFTLIKNGRKSMTDTVPFLKLTNDGAHKILAAAVAKAEEIGIPECISVVDPGGHLICFTKMDGAFVQSIDSSLRKAMTSASYGNPTGLMPEGPDIRLAIATDGKRINLPGGLPIIVVSAWVRAPARKTSWWRKPDSKRSKARRSSTDAATGRGSLT